MPFDLIVRGNEVIWPCRAPTGHDLGTHSLRSMMLLADGKVCPREIKHLEGLCRWLL